MEGGEARAPTLHQFAREVLLLITLKSWAASMVAITLVAPQAGVARSPVASRASAIAAAQSLSASTRQSAAIAALRKRVKYVFVLYQENRSFDSYFARDRKN
jgi:phospholipase C